MSDVFVTYKGQAKFRDNWDRVFKKKRTMPPAPSGKPDNAGEVSPSAPVGATADCAPIASMDGGNRVYMLGNPFTDNWVGFVL